MAKSQRKKPQPVQKARKVLKKEVNLPVKLPDNKVGKTLNKPRRLRAPKYFSKAWAELRKVIWPTRKEAWKLTLAVFIFSAFFAVVIALADLVFKNIAERIFL